MNEYRKAIVKVAVLAIIGGGVALVATGNDRSGVDLRYRLTVEVQTPEGLKTGSSVIENRLYGKSFLPLPGDIGSAGSSGEAVTVDLGGGRFLFAVRADPLYERDVLRIVPQVLAYPELKLGTPDEGTRVRMAKAIERKSFAVLRRKDYPMLVTFADMNNPSSAAEVNPDNLAASFGARYSLARITFQAVDGKTPLTKAFADRFPVIANFRGNFRKKPLDEPRDVNLSATMGANSFFIPDRK